VGGRGGRRQGINSLKVSTFTLTMIVYMLEFIVVLFSKLQE